MYDYKILNPGGNKTALVYGSFDSSEKKKINDSILLSNKDVEQVGFLNGNRLDMAGGEFCVNATRCAVYELLNGRKGEVSISVSGYNGNIVGGIDDKGVYAFLDINKSLDEIFEVKIISGLNFNIVKIDGIWHVILNLEESKKYISLLKENEEEGKLVLKELLSKVKTSESAIGIILTEKVESYIKINPVVWVKSIDTLYYETACGSGSLAYAIYNYLNNASCSSSVIQPSSYRINVDLIIENNVICKAKISGVVKDE